MLAEEVISSANPTETFEDPQRYAEDREERTQPPQQPYPVQPGQAYQPSFAPGPARMPRWLIWVVVGVVVIVIAGALLAFAVIPYFEQPKITLTDACHTTTGCVFSAPQWTYMWTFTLVNSGNANGFATVEFYLNGQPNIGTYSTVVYLVPLGTQVAEQHSVSTSDCGSYIPGVTITSVVKA